MGVVTIHGYIPPDGKSGQQAADNLVKILETLGAVKVGNFFVECESYYSTPSSGFPTPKNLNVFHNSEHPASCFSLLDTGTCLVSESSFDNLLLNMGSFYQPKKSSRMESKGPKFSLGDFTIKIGSVTIGTSFRGILIEVEYGPCVVPAYCWELLREFMGSFMSPPRDPHQYLQGKMNEIFTPVDTIQQYNDHFKCLRSQLASSGQNLMSQQQSQSHGPSTPQQISIPAK